MLRDAFAQAPDPFGRCDEFEMEEAGLLRKVFGLDVRIAMLTSDHVVSEVKLEGGYLRLDSSFLRCVAFARRPLVDEPPEDGVYSVARTNRLALSDLHETRRLDARGVERVRAAFAAFLVEPDGAAVFCHR
jgi:hypothetical protein